MTTSILNGFGTRVITSYDQGQKGWTPWINGVKGAAEGAYFGHYIGGNERLAGLGRWSRTGNYLSSFLTESATSVPGLGFTVASYQLAYLMSYYEWALVPEHPIFIALALSPADELGVLELYNKYVFDKYPYIIKTFPWLK